MLFAFSECPYRVRVSTRNSVFGGNIFTCGWNFSSTQIQVIFVEVIRSDLVILVRMNTIVISELCLVEMECPKPNGLSICDAGVVIVFAPAAVSRDLIEVAT